MLLRGLIVLVAIFALATVLRAWRRPPRIARLDMRDLRLTGPSVVQFTTPWCAPCKTAAPHLRRVADEAGIAYAQVDVADRPEIARRYGIRSVPTIVVVRENGRVLGTWTSLPRGDELVRAARAA